MCRDNEPFLSEVMVLLRGLDDEDRPRFVELAARHTHATVPCHAGVRALTRLAALPTQEWTPLLAAAAAWSSASADALERLLSVPRPHRELVLALPADRLPKPLSSAQTDMVVGLPPHSPETARDTYAAVMETLADEAAATRLEVWGAAMRAAEPVGTVRAALALLAPLPEASSGRPEDGPDARPEAVRRLKHTVAALARAPSAALAEALVEGARRRGGPAGADHRLVEHVSWPLFSRLAGDADDLAARIDVATELAATADAGWRRHCTDFLLAVTPAETGLEAFRPALDALRAVYRPGHQLTALAGLMQRSWPSTVGAAGRLAAVPDALTVLDGPSGRGADDGALGRVEAALAFWPENVRAEALAAQVALLGARLLDDPAALARPMAGAQALGLAALRELAPVVAERLDDTLLEVFCQQPPASWPGLGRFLAAAPAGLQIPLPLYFALALEMPPGQREAVVRRAMAAGNEGEARLQAEIARLETAGLGRLVRLALSAASSAADRVGAAHNCLADRGDSV